MDPEESGLFCSAGFMDCPLTERKEIKNLLDEGESYLKTLDETVKSFYIGKQSEPLEHCRKTVLRLKLPDIYINPIVDHAFRGHMK